MTMRLLVGSTLWMGLAVLGCGGGADGVAPMASADGASADAPEADAPGADAPSADAPSADASGADAPDADASSAGAPAACDTSPPTAVSALPIADVFARALISRAYEQQRWVMRDPNGGANRQDASSAAAALAGLRPSYISGLVYLQNGTVVTQGMADDFRTIRAAARAANPDVRIDVEISLNPSPPPPKLPFASADALVAQMAVVDCQLHPDAWIFDFYSNAQQVHPDWIVAAIGYAHAHGQLVGGNVFGGQVPPGSDFVAFVDKAVAGSSFGFDFNLAEVESLRRSSPSTLLVGHLQSNPQNGPTTESCVYSNDWDQPTRAAYLRHWASSQQDVGFRFFYPVFYPLCPGAIAFDSTLDLGPFGSSLYDRIGHLMSTFNP
jgi:hypothetical protein